MRSEQFMSSYRRKINGKTLDTRLEQLTQLREADGYMSSWEQDQDNTFILREANCPIINVAAGCEAACSHDKAMLETLLDAQVIRKGHLAKGDGACVYEVRPKIEVEQ
jgi:predicted ArsR family transcriptional regulator